MITVTNNLRQPLTFSLRSGVGFYLLPLATGDVEEADMSDELRRAAQRGDIALSRPAKAATISKGGD